MRITKIFSLLLFTIWVGAFAQTSPPPPNPGGGGSSPGTGTGGSTPGGSTLATNEFIDIDSNDSYAAYNSASGNFEIVFNKKWKRADLSIFDFSGRVIFEKVNIDTKNNFPLSGFNKNGSLLVIKLVYDKNNVTVLKFLK